MELFIGSTIRCENHSLYRISILCNSTNQKWMIHRRYSQFEQLKVDLLQLFKNSRRPCPGCISFESYLHQFKFPEKKWRHSSCAVVHDRVGRFQNLMQALVKRIYGYQKTNCCYVCGVMVHAIVKPFITRGLKPLGNSSVKRILRSIHAPGAENNEQNAHRSYYSSTHSTYRMESSMSGNIKPNSFCIS